MNCRVKGRSYAWARHKGVWESVGIAALILDLDTRWEGVVILTSHRYGLSPTPRNNPKYPPNNRLCCCYRRYGGFSVQNGLLRLSGIRPRFRLCPRHSLVTVSDTYFRFLFLWVCYASNTEIMQRRDTWCKGTLRQNSSSYPCTRHEGKWRRLRYSSNHFEPRHLMTSVVNFTPQPLYPRERILALLNWNFKVCHPRCVVS